MPPTRVPSELSHRRQIVEAGRRLSDRGLVAPGDGNLSMRVFPNRILITPAGADKGRLKPTDLLVVDLEGTLRGSPSGRRPSTEMPMHLEVYRSVPSANAVVHAHPPFATALTVAGLAFPSDILPEIVATLGEVPVTEMAMPGTLEDAEAIRPLLANHRGMLLPHHGSLTYGQTLEEAMTHLERIEHAALVFWLATALGKANRLPAGLVARLAGLRRSGPEGG